MAKDVFDTSNINRGGLLPPAFYLGTDVVELARTLLGKVLVTQFEGARTAVRITETEAYRAPDDRACHAWNNRRTSRTEVMFQSGGRAYIYLCYGIHHLFNVVTAPEGMAHAVLIRAGEPLEGLGYMMERRGFPPEFAGEAKKMQRLTTGPGALANALALSTKWTGQSFFDADAPFWIEDDGFRVPDNGISAGKRVGVDYAGPCADWPWRFWLSDSPYVRR